MKNRVIEFYRFLAIICIALFHFNIQFTGEFLFPKGGYLGVEFFFILSGFFLMKTYQSPSHPDTAWKFWWRRIKSLYPAYLIMMGIFLLFDLFVRRYITSPTELFLRLGDEIWDLLLLQNIGIPGVFSYEGSLWFLTSLSINLYVIYHLLLKYEEVYINFLIPLLCILFYGYIGKNFGSLSMQEEWIWGVYGGLVRGFLAMSLGVLTYKAVPAVGNLPSVVVKTAEIICLLYSGYILNRGFCIEDFKVLVLFPIIIVSAMTSKSVLSKLLDNPLSEFLGAVSYEIYLNHLLISTALTMFGKNIPYCRAVLIYIAAIIVLAIIIHGSLCYFRNLFYKYRKKKV